MSSPTATVTAQPTRKSKRRRDDMQCNPLDGLCWKTSEVEESLAIVFHHVRDDALEAIDWYKSSRRPKKLLAIYARTVAIGLFGAAAALPLVDPLITAVTIDSLWIALLIALAGGALALDRFLGGTSGWIRCMKTELQLRDELETFELEWEFARAALQGNVPTCDQTAAFLQRAKAFASHVNTVVQTETNAWVEEFQTSVKQIDDALRSRASDTRDRDDRRRGTPVFAVPIPQTPTPSQTNGVTQEVSVQ
jgi:hypothetical protein